MSSLHLTDAQLKTAPNADTYFEALPCCNTHKLQLPYLASAFKPNCGVCRFPQGVYPDGKGALGSQHTGDLPLELGGCLTNQGCMVDQTILGRLMLCLQRPAHTATPSEQ